jgi:rfaE bifunctional protein kinase chain/domain
VGRDTAALDFEKLMTTEGMDTRGIIKSPNRATTVKTRIISGSQQLVRIDEEEIKPLSRNENDELLLVISEFLETERIDVVIFEDYDKGTLSPLLIQGVMELAGRFGIPTAVDPKKDNFLAYSGATLFKPNLKELREGLKTDFNSGNPDILRNQIQPIPEKLKIQKLLLTLSEHGAVMAGKGGAFLHSPAHLRQIADVSGAGDTVISVAALCLAAGCSDAQILELANLAGGLVCEHVGVVPVNKQNLLEEALFLLTKNRE